jgi:dual specificity phosphatase 12
MPTEILTGLWLGSKTDAYDEDFIVKKNITNILNCTKTVSFPPFYETMRGLKYYRLPIDDQPDNYKNEREQQQMYSKLNMITDYIHTALSSEQSILVHCYAGKQRSAAVIAAYMMKYGKIGMHISIDYIKAKKPTCFSPMINFEYALQQFETDLKHGNSNSNSSNNNNGHKNNGHSNIHHNRHSKRY